jgi:hypothetical protein
LRRENLSGNKINLKTQTEPITTDWNRKKRKQKKRTNQPNKKKERQKRKQKNKKRKTQSTSGQVTNTKADREKEHGKVGWMKKIYDRNFASLILGINYNIQCFFIFL